MTSKKTAFAALASLFFCAPAGAQQSLPFEPLAIETSEGRICRYRVELADEPRERQIGLMFRRQMDDDKGMLFDFETEREIQMWMKNTYIPLDMLFADKEGVITHIATDTTPESLDTISSKGPARAVLELNAGAAAACGARMGDRLVHGLFE